MAFAEITSILLNSEKAVYKICGSELAITGKKKEQTYI
jgi:hypothetical protein